MYEFLSSYHRDILEKESGIPREIVNERKYQTIRDRKNLNELGFDSYQCKVPGLLIPIWGPHGEITSYQFRPDEPRMRNGKKVKYESLPNKQSRIDVPRCIREQLKDPNVPLWITEGVKKADAAAGKGLVCVALPGVWNWRGKNEFGGKEVIGDFDQIPLNSRLVFLAFDSDALEKDGVRKALDRLSGFLTARGASVRIVLIPPLPDGKAGLDDYFVNGGTTEVLIETAVKELPVIEKPKEAKSEALIKLAEDHATLWHDSKFEAYATVTTEKGTWENLRLRDSKFREWLTGLSYKATGSAPTRDTLDRAIETLCAKAKFECVLMPTEIRIGHASDDIWLDLFDGKGNVVQINADGWMLKSDSDCPIRFLRPQNFVALPLPSKSGSLDKLQELLSVEQDGLELIKLYLVGAFMPPPGAMPILFVSGEHGSGKSFGCRTIRSLIDPSLPSLRNSPKEADDLIASLHSGFILGFDNLSNITSWLSDSLCSLATGGGLAKRKLYTDGDEFVVTGRRPIIINGITDEVNAPDLAERCLFIEFKRMRDESRKTEKELIMDFDRLAPGILGAILDRVSLAMRQLDSVETTHLPRMADFCKWGLASVSPDKRDSLQLSINENRNMKNKATIDDDSVAFALQNFVKDQIEWSGTARELLYELERDEKIEKKNRPHDWPRSPEALGKRIRRLKPVLRAVGIEMSFGKGTVRTIRISQEGAEKPSDPSEPSISNASESAVVAFPEVGSSGEPVSWHDEPSSEENQDFSSDLFGEDSLVGLDSRSENSTSEPGRFF